MDKALELVRWIQYRNHLAYQSHRKRKVEEIAVLRAYNDGDNPIYLIVTFWMEPWYYDITDSYVREEVKNAFRKMVAAHKDHPAILMWSIGNELNAPWMYKDHLNILFNLIDEMAQEAHEEEGENAHPVTTPLADDIDLID